METIIKSMDKMMIDENVVVNNEPEFVLDNSLENDSCYFVAKVQLSFYQIWSMFLELPCVYDSKRCKYEWKFLHKRTGAVFSIYDWKNKQNLLNTKTWYIGSSTNDSKLTADFLKVLCDAIECYNKYYKIPVETKTFSSNIPEVQSALDNIKRTIFENKSILSSL